MLTQHGTPRRDFIYQADAGHWGRRMTTRQFGRRRLFFEALEPRRMLATFVVNSTADLPDSGFVPGTCDTELNPDADPPIPASGICTLRAAVNSANANPGPDVVHFGIPGASVPTINLATELQVVGGPIDIDATTQAAGTVEVRSASSVLGLLFGSNGSTIRGLTINNSAGGIGITSDNNRIVGNRFGVDPSGKNASPITGTAIGILGNGNVIGGSELQDRNIIANSGAGVDIASVAGISSTQNVIRGNYIGTDVTGTVAMGLIDAAISIRFASGTVVENNILAASATGVRILGNTATGTQITGNLIGTDESGGVTNPDGLVDNGDEFGNGKGIFVNDAPGVMIMDNVIAGSSGIGTGIDFGYGVHIVNSNASGAILRANKIGVNSSGNAVLANKADGVLIESASNILIGGDVSSDRNIISGNGGDGITIFGTSANPAVNNRIAGNYIGVDASGLVALGNKFRGVHLDAHANGNVVGGTALADRNIISGNESDGVIIASAGAIDNLVVGNYIGTDKNGNKDLGNNKHGVHILNASRNQIGGVTSAQRNVISGNDLSGVRIFGQNSLGNQISGNYVGTDSSGQVPLGNSDSGVLIENANDNFVGIDSANPSSGNTISANRDGVVIKGSSATGNVVAGNFIGTDAQGGPGPMPAAFSLGNHQNGVLIEGAVGNFLGPHSVPASGCSPQTATEINVIAGNMQSGVVIVGDTATGNRVLCNSIFGNAKLGIDLQADGVSPNEPSDTDIGPNQLQNFPVLSMIERSEGSVRVGGTLSSQPNTTYRVDFFATDVSEATKMEHGLQGQRYLGTHSTTTDATGYIHFEVELPKLVEGEIVTATATDALGNTSEFSPFASDIDGKGTFEVRTPVLVVPGIFGSFALDIPGVLGDEGNYRKWLLNVGIDPTELQIDPLIHVYDDLIQSLENAGYEKGRDLFVAPYDWRLNLAPITTGETEHDGKITGVSGASLTDSSIEFGLDYLGYWLKQAAEQWFANYGQPLVSVNIVAHSMGGLLARSYIQSSAYGDTFSSAIAGRELNLPVASNLTMLGVPNQGGAGAWNPWFDNFVADPAYKFVLSKVINNAWQKLQAGATITVGTDVQLTKESFLGLDERDQKIQFVRRYGAGLGNLLPSFPGFAIDFDPAAFPEAKNLLLSDLNREVLFGDRVARTIVTYGTSGNDAVISTSSTQARVQQHVGGLIGDFDVVLSFTDYEADDAANGEIYWEDILLPGHGDGTVAIESLEEFFDNDSRVELFPFCDGMCRAGDISSSGSVTHTGIVSNVDMQALYLEALGHPLEAASISTGSVTLGLDLLLPFAVYNLVADPVQEAFLVDSQGRRLGYSSATGPLTEIPDSFYFGNEDGIGWIFGDTQLRLTLELLGAGREHYVQASGNGLTDGFGVESTGFLALGERRTLPLELDEPPMLRILQPFEGDGVLTGSTIEILVEATDDVEIRSVDVLLNSSLQETLLQEPFVANIKIPNVKGEQLIEACATDSVGHTSCESVIVHGFEPPLSGVGTLIAGSGAGLPPVVELYNPDGTESYRFFAYNPSFLGGVRVAGGDFNGDGIQDIVTAAGDDAGPQVKIFDGLNGAQLGGFVAFPGFNGTLNVAAGDVTGDGIDDIIVGSGAGILGGEIKVFDALSLREVSSFVAFEGFSGGVFVAAGDVNSDGQEDIIVGAGSGTNPNGRPQVKVFDGHSGLELNSFFAYEPSFTGGVRVSAGDVNGDGTTDIITGAGPGAGPHVKVFNGLDFLELDSFIAFDSDYSGGVFVAGADINNDQFTDIAVSARLQDNFAINFFDGNTLDILQELTFPDGFESGDVSIWSTPTDPPPRVVNLPPAGGTQQISIDGDDLVIQRADGVELFRGPQDGFPRIRINGAQDVDDLLIVNWDGLTRRIIFNGNTGGNDGVQLEGDQQIAELAYEFKNDSDGRIINTSPGGAGEALVFLGLEPITDNLAVVDRVFVFPDTADDIVFDTGDVMFDSIVRIDSNHSEVVHFREPSGSLTIESGPNDTADIGPGWSFSGTEVADGKFARILTRDNLTLRMVGPHDWQYPANPLDVNANGFVSALDVLLIINELNFPQFHLESSLLVNAASLAQFPQFFFDVTGDDLISPIDVLRIINFLNEDAGGEGEGLQAAAIDDGFAFPLDFSERSSLNTAERLADRLESMPSHLRRFSTINRAHRLDNGMQLSEIGVKKCASSDAYVAMSKPIEERIATDLLLAKWDGLAADLWI